MAYSGKKITTTNESNNGIYCDGEEICVAGHCMIDPEQPSCVYKGGVCDEASKICTLPRVRQEWRASLPQKETEYRASADNGKTNAFMKASALTGNEHISQDVVGVTSLAIIGFVTGLLALFALTITIAKVLSGTLGYHY